MNRLKTNILLTLSVIIIGVASIVTGYGIVHDKEQYDEHFLESYQSVRLIYKETIQDTAEFYTARGNSIALSEEMMNAFKSRDHDTLYRLILPRWKVLRQENPSLIVMQFHNGDGTSLLRMHQPDIYGDQIAAKRAMVAYVHQHRTTAYGFEEGRQGLAFRIIVPLMHQGVYVGAVEFGMAAPHIIEKIHRYTSYDSFFLVHQNIVGTFTRIDRYLSIGEYIAIDLSPKLIPLMQEYARLYHTLENRVVEYGGQSFAMTAIPVLNYQNRPIGAVMFIQSVPDFSTHVIQMIVASALIALILMVVLGLIVHRVYDAIANKMNFQEMYNQTVLDAIPSPVIVSDGHQLIAANQTFLAYFNYPNIASFKREHACVCEYFEEGDTEDYLMPMVNDQRWSEYISDHPLIQHKAKITIEGKTTLFEVKLSLLKFREESRYVVIFTDISSMQSRSMTDPLTGIANRLHFTMVFEHTINIARRDQKSLGVIFFDIDHFKQVNDLHGHLAGDMILQHITNLIKRRLRKSDFFARWGGEEFIVLLPATPLDETVHLAETLRLAIETETFETVGHITCSFGVSALNENESSEELLKRTDELLYNAKENGRNRVIWQ